MQRTMGCIFCWLKIFTYSDESWIGSREHWLNEFFATLAARNGLTITLTVLELEIMGHNDTTTTPPLSHLLYTYVRPQLVGENTKIPRAEALNIFEFFEFSRG